MWDEDPFKSSSHLRTGKHVIIHYTNTFCTQEKASMKASGHRFEGEDVSPLIQALYQFSFRWPVWADWSILHHSIALTYFYWRFTTVQFTSYQTLNLVGLDSHHIAAGVVRAHRTEQNTLHSKVMVETSLYLFHKDSKSCEIIGIFTSRNLGRFT